MKYITLVMLVKADACDDQRILFEDTFGKKAELTTANMAKAIEAGLRFEWLVPLLPQPALEAYRVQRAPLWEDYRAKYDLLREAYMAQREPLLGTLAVKHASLLKAYRAKRNTLLLNSLLAA